MTEDLRAHLLALATALPAGSAVPVPREWLLALLEPAVATPALIGEPADDHLLSADQVAARFGLTKDRLYRNWKRIPGAVKLGKRPLRFTLTGVRRYLASAGCKAS
jgi:predicted DNA-binding transcriptional regulator AlpA